jgi:nucleoside-diphosphate-sugar epimerase
MKHQRVLVTGATGFIGGAVVRSLVAGGHEVTGLVRSESGTAALGLKASGVRLAVGDMLHPETYRGLAGEADAVVHTAQFAVKGRLTRTKITELGAANHLMTTTLARACVAARNRLVYTSGTFNYSDCGDSWITEATPFNPSPLGETHAKEVTALRELSKQGSLDLVVVAPGFVLGPGGYFKEALYDQARHNRLRVIGSGHNYWSCIQVDDLAAAFAAALERAPAGAEFNVVDDKPLTLRALVDSVTAAMGMKRVGNIPPVRHEPAHRTASCRVHGQLVSRQQPEGARGAGLVAALSNRRPIASLDPGGAQLEITVSPTILWPRQVLRSTPYPDGRQPA